MNLAVPRPGTAAFTGLLSVRGRRSARNPVKVRAPTRPADDVHSRPTKIAVRNGHPGLARTPAVRPANDQPEPAWRRATSPSAVCRLLPSQTATRGLTFGTSRFDRLSGDDCYASLMSTSVSACRRDTRCHGCAAYPGSVCPAGGHESDSSESSSRSSWLLPTGQLHADLRDQLAERRPGHRVLRILVQLNESANLRDDVGQRLLRYLRSRRFRLARLVPIDEPR
jgi:hypothetical protein